MSSICGTLCSSVFMSLLGGLCGIVGYCGWATYKGEINIILKVTSSWSLYPHWTTMHGQPYIKIKNIYFVLNNVFFRKSYRLWDNVEKHRTAKQTTDYSTIRRMRIAWWVHKATNTHSEYVIVIAFPLQQWLRERVSVLRYTYIVFFLILSPHSLVLNFNFRSSLLSPRKFSPCTISSRTSSEAVLFLPCSGFVSHAQFQSSTKSSASCVPSLFHLNPIHISGYFQTSNQTAHRRRACHSLRRNMQWRYSQSMTHPGWFTPKRVKFPL